jgi:hypothetical protein
LYHRDNPNDLIAVIVAALLAPAAILVDLPTGIVKPVAALALVLILPGYSLSALLPARMRSNWLIRFALTVGLSMAIAALGGLVLNLTPWGITEAGWIVWLCGITLLAGGIALAFRPSISKPRGLRVRMAGRSVALLLVAVDVAILAAIVARWGAVQQSGADSTQLWLLADQPSSPQVVTVGIRNLEADTMTYRLLVVSDDVASGDVVLGEWAAITLSPAEQSETKLTIPSDGSSLGKVEAQLYVVGKAAVYRDAVLRFGTPSTAQSPAAAGGSRPEFTTGE